MTTWTPRRQAICRLTIVLLGLGACGDNLTSPETRRARWNARGTTYYTYVSSYSCECLPDFATALQVTVSNNAVTAIRSVASGQPAPMTYRPTIDGLFDLIESEQRSRPALLDVSYDATLSYPTRIKYGTPENDGGGVITVTSLTITR